MLFIAVPQVGVFFDLDKAQHKGTSGEGHGLGQITH